MSLAVAIKLVATPAITTGLLVAKYINKLFRKQIKSPEVFMNKVNLLLGKMKVKREIRIINPPVIYART